jgi:hypothetical protein
MADLRPAVRTQDATRFSDVQCSMLDVGFALASFCTPTCLAHEAPCQRAGRPLLYVKERVQTTCIASIATGARWHRPRPWCRSGATPCRPSEASRTDVRRRGRITVDGSHRVSSLVFSVRASGWTCEASGEYFGADWPFDVEQSKCVCVRVDLFYKSGCSIILHTCSLQTPRLASIIQKACIPITQCLSLDTSTNSRPWSSTFKNGKRSI